MYVVQSSPLSSPTCPRLAYTPWIMPTIGIPLYEDLNIEMEIFIIHNYQLNWDWIRQKFPKMIQWSQWYVELKMPTIQSHTWHDRCCNEKNEHQGNLCLRLDNVHKIYQPTILTFDSEYNWEWKPMCMIIWGKNHPNSVWDSWKFCVSSSSMQDPEITIFTILVIRNC